MNTVYPLTTAMLLAGMCCLTPVQAAGNGMSNGHGSHYNPWRPQQQQWRYRSQANGHAENGHAMNGHEQGHSHSQRALPVGQHAYPLPLYPVQVRQAEYRHYVQQVSPFYRNSYYGNSGGLPWWSDPLAVPYGPWATGNGWPNGLW